MYRDAGEPACVTIDQVVTVPTEERSVSLDFMISGVLERVCVGNRVSIENAARRIRAIQRETS